MSARSRTAKKLATAILRPLAAADLAAGGALRRAWSFARLRAALDSPVDASVVLLGPAEVHGTGRVSLGRDLLLYPGVYLETRGDGRVVVGDGVVLSRGVHLVARSVVEVGEGSILGEYASVRDANHRFDGVSSPRGTGHDAKPVRIGRNVWIGRGAVVLPGVTIGDGAVVGANAVVTRPVAAGTVVGGAPARPLSSRSSSSSRREIADAVPAARRLHMAKA